MLLVSAIVMVQSKARDAWHAVMKCADVVYSRGCCRDAGLCPPRSYCEYVSSHHYVESTKRYSLSLTVRRAMVSTPFSVRVNLALNVDKPRDVGYHIAAYIA